MKATLILIVAILSHINSAYCQLQNANWFYGFGSIINFNQTSPTFDTTIMGSLEGSICISDSTGELLFYSNAAAIFSKNHQLMENGYGIHCDGSSGYSGVIDPVIQGGTTSAQGIIALPLKNNKYYLFNVTRYGSGINTLNHRKVLFTEIDMNANNGLGKVTSKNNVVFDIPFRNLGEQLAAIKHANGRDWWVIGTGIRLNNNFNIDSTFFYKILITPIGIQSVTYQYITEFEFQSVGMGGISLNNTAELIAFCCTNNTAYVCSFDRCTGNINLVSNLSPSLSGEITGEDQVYSCCFAPNSNLLYVSSFKKVFQYNCDATNIPASKQLIYVNSAFTTQMGDGSIHLGALRRSINGKIYQSILKYPFPNYSSHKLSVINSPDVYGTGCNYSFNNFYTGNQNCYGLPNNEITWHLGRIIDSPCDTICWDEPALFSNTLSICQGDSVWLYGAYRYVSGTYGDTLHNYKGCDSIIYQTVLTVHGINVMVTQNNNILTVTQAGLSYQWYNCETEQPISGAINQSYTATQNGLYYVVLSDANGCSARSECYAVTSVSAQDLWLSSTITLYPNPAKKTVRIESSMPLQQITVSDVLGRVLLQADATHQTQYTLDLSALPAGIYFVKAGSHKVMKLVKE